MRDIFLTEQVAPLYRAAMLYQTQAAYKALASILKRGNVRPCEMIIIKRAAFWKENENG